jgi:hypothetical protein
MPGSQPPVTLHVEQGALPAMMAAFDEAIIEVRNQVQRLGQTAYIPQPWLGDPVSGPTQTHYNSVVMDSADGGYAAMTAYLNELIAIRENLQAVQEQYLRGEGNIAAEMRPQP